MSSNRRRVRRADRNRVIELRSGLVIPARDIEISAIRASGSGGQHVNKVSTAVHLRFDIRASSLPARFKERLLSWRDQRISDDGVIVIKAQSFRSREKNLAEAHNRLRDLVLEANREVKRRVPTRPSRRARQKRVDAKTRQSRTKALRGKVDY